MAYRSIYEDYDEAKLDSHLSSFLVSSWSYSAVSQFASNEKAFERSYIYCERSRDSVSAIAGSAYHAALEEYFKGLKLGLPEMDIISLEQKAYEYIDSVPANKWKLQKTTPTVEKCIKKATATINFLIESFVKEKDIYTADIDEILVVEEKWEEWLRINGVDIPLPCHGKVDMVARLKDGRIVIIDHKSVSKYTDEAAIALTRGKQAIVYYKMLEKHLGLTASEVWFIESKTSKNSDGSPQLVKKVLTIDDDTLHLYEALLYEPLRRMIQAVNDPDYVYTINDRDNLADPAEMYDFWTKTMIAEVDDFPYIPEKNKPLVAKRLKKVRDSSLANINPKIITSFRKKAATFIQFDYSTTDMSNSEKIEHVLRTFGMAVQVYKQIEGFSSDTYLLQVSSGVKVSNIRKYALDIANALDVPSVRISAELEVYEGKSYLAIEVNHPRTRTLDWDAKYLEDHKIPLGIDNYGRVVVWDLMNQATPHLLDCGGTGSGKSVLIKSTIAYAEKLNIRIIIFDPKYEFGPFRSSHEVVSDIESIEARMKKLVDEMQKLNGQFGGLTLIIFDEFADAVASARQGHELDIREMVQDGFYKDGRPKYREVVTGKERSLEENLKMILQKGRSLGYRVLAATQRASTKVITGDAKVNFPVQVCFKVPKAIDSKVVLDEEGAETLVGKGDGLIKSPEYLDRLVRFQGFFKQ